MKTTGVTNKISNINLSFVARFSVANVKIAHNKYTENRTHLALYPDHNPGLRYSLRVISPAGLHIELDKLFAVALFLTSWMPVFKTFDKGQCSGSNKPDKKIHIVPRGPWNNCITVLLEDLMIILAPNVVLNEGQTVG